MKKRGQKWRPDELEILVKLRRAGNGWDAISAQLAGRTASACMASYQNAKGRAARAAAREALRERIVQAKANARAWTPPQRPAAAVMATPAPGRLSVGRMSTSALRIDAELRGRIEILGITGGLLGDPPPGRSALDARRAVHTKPVSQQLNERIEDAICGSGNGH